MSTRPASRAVWPGTSSTNPGGRCAFATLGLWRHAAGAVEGGAASWHECIHPCNSMKHGAYNKSPCPCKT